MPKPSWTKGNVQPRKNLRVEIIQTKSVNNAQVNYLVKYVGGFSAQDKAQALPFVIDALKKMHDQVRQKVNERVGQNPQLDQTNLNNTMNMQWALNNPNSLASQNADDALGAQEAQSAADQQAQISASITESLDEQSAATTIQSDTESSKADTALLGVTVASALIKLEAGDAPGFLQDAQSISQQLTGKESKLEDFSKHEEKSETKFAAPKPVPPRATPPKDKD